MTALREDLAHELGFMQWLLGNGYTDPKPLGNGRYACIRPLVFTHAIITGRIGDTSSYDDRWCYNGYEAAKAALDAWDGTGEPEGWHRHPGSGRRRDGVTEQVRW